MVAQQTKSLLLPPAPPALTTPDGRVLFDWVQRELELLIRRLNTVSEVRLEVLYVAPTRPRAGMLAYADGTTWNPGSGEGLYRYTLAGTWAFVG